MFVKIESATKQIMPYKHLAHFIHALEEAGALVRIKEYVNPHLEITEITDRISKALLSFVQGAVVSVNVELHTELEDGRTFLLKAGMSYQVADNAEAHRSSTSTGAKLFIVD